MVVAPVTSVVALAVGAALVVLEEVALVAVELPLVAIAVEVPVARPHLLRTRRVLTMPPHRWASLVPMGISRMGILRMGFPRLDLLVALLPLAPLVVVLLV